MKRWILAVLFVLPVAAFAAPGMHGPSSGAIGGGGGGRTCADIVDAVSVCEKLKDRDNDGDIDLEDLRATFNALLYPGGVLTTALKAYIEPPKAATYTMTSVGNDQDGVKWCYDSSPPADGSEALMDCTGNSAAVSIPVLHFLPGWKDVHLSFVWINDHRDGNDTLSAFWFGDSAADNTDADLYATGSGIASIYFSDPTDYLQIGITDQESLDTTSAFYGVTCDGCVGDLRVRLSQYQDIEPSADNTAAVARVAGPGNGAFPAFTPRLNVWLSDRASGADNSQIAGSLFLGDLTGVVLRGDEWTIAPNFGDSNDCSWGVAWTYDSCVNLEVAEDFVLIDPSGGSGGGFSWKGAGLNFKGSVRASGQNVGGGLWVSHRKNCAETFYAPNIVSGLVECNFTASFCVRTLIPASSGGCTIPNLAVLDGRIVQKATPTLDRNSPILPAHHGTTYLGDRLTVEYGNPNWIAGCHTSKPARVIGYNSMKRRLRLTGYTGDPGTGQCIQFTDAWDNTGVAACGSATTRWVVDRPIWLSGYSVNMNAAAHANHACRIRVVANGTELPNDPGGGTGDCTLFAYHATLVWGGTAAACGTAGDCHANESNTTAAYGNYAWSLRADKAVAQQRVGDYIAAGTAIEVKISDAAGNQCSAEAACDCNGAVNNINGIEVLLEYLEMPTGTNNYY